MTEAKKSIRANGEIVAYAAVLTCFVLGAVVSYTLFVLQFHDLVR